MKIQVFGTGCARFDKLVENVNEAVRIMDINCTIEIVRDIIEILNSDVPATPALFINGQMICFGRLMSVEEITAALEHCCLETAC